MEYIIIGILIAIGFFLAQFIIPLIMAIVALPILFIQWLLDTKEDNKGFIIGIIVTIVLAIIIF